MVKHSRNWDKIRVTHAHERAVSKRKNKNSIKPPILLPMTREAPKWTPYQKSFPQTKNSCQGPDLEGRAKYSKISSTIKTANPRFKGSHPRNGIWTNQI